MENILELTDSSYSSFMEANDSVVFIDFYSETCAPCRTLLLYLNNLEEHYKGDNIVIAKVNVSRNPKLSNKFMVRNVPLTTLIGRDKTVKRAETGLLHADAYYTMIDKELGKNKWFLSRLLSKKRAFVSRLFSKRKWLLNKLLRRK